MREAMRQLPGNGAIVIELRAYKEARLRDALRRRNLRDMAAAGYFGVAELSNGWTVARCSGTAAARRYTLLSPEGRATLYGASIDEVIWRGFPAALDDVLVISGEGAWQGRRT
jgi:hypothetical protein